MAFGDRVDDLRFRNNPQSPREESAFPSFTSPLRPMGSLMQPPSAQDSSSAESRASLQRRFTTNTVPTLPTLTPLSPIGQQRRQAAEPSSDLTSATYHKVQLLEKKKLEYEFLREQRRRFEAEMELIDMQAKREEDEMHRLAHDLGRFSASGHQSEPTTPPEYRDGGFPSVLSRPNRFSASSLTSPPGLSAMSTRPSRSGSQITSPPADLSRSFASQKTPSHLPSKSVPGSRRNSDEEDDDFEPEITTMKPRSGALNRNSMPVTRMDLRGRSDMPDFAAVFGQGHVNTTGFLFDDGEDNPVKRNASSSTDVKTYLQMNTTDDKFPILVRRDGDGTVQLSASSAALDLALSQSPGPESQQNGWPSFARHRPAQQSLPMNNLREDLASSSSSSGLPIETPTKPPHPNRRSMEVKFSPYADKRSSILEASPNGATAGMPKLQSSYSTNDIPTMKSPNGLNGAAAVGAGSSKSHAEQHLHNHNASLGRIPPGVVPKRQSRELPGGEASFEEPNNTFRPHQSGLQASAPPFGPSVNPTSSTVPMTGNVPAGMPGYPNGAYYGGYGMPMMQMAMGNMHIGNPPQWSPQMNAYQGPYGGYPQPYQQYGPGRFQDNQSRVMQQRRMQNADENSRFANQRIEDMRGEIYALCKDQHGCRFLQKTLEERNPSQVQLIFEETNQHVIELMTDPFGNYLCQKLLEFTNDDQRTVLINNAAPQMVKIALNQHGTRALQKMIEFVSTPAQIQTIIRALEGQVVDLIKDLNGNHVIQKCLNHLSAEDAQFIFDAVGENCVTVGTHRHGCCVLQRCIDHASPAQKAQLVNYITANAFALVQDPFGNYVVQYILDLGPVEFSRPMCLGFRGSVAALSKQKFSSNVIEKCIRTADPEVKRMIIDELMNPADLEKLLRDSYGNYVVQTAMDHADSETKHMLTEAIRPHLPAIRQTPHGRRIQGKMSEREGRTSGNSSGQITPHDATSPGQLPLSNHVTPSRSRQIPNQSSGVTSPASNFSSTNGYASSIASPQPYRVNNQPLTSQLQAAVSQAFPPYGHSQQSNGLNYL